MELASDYVNARASRNFCLKIYSFIQKILKFVWGHTDPPTAVTLISITFANFIKIDLMILICISA